MQLYPQQIELAVSALLRFFDSFENFFQLITQAFKGFFQFFAIENSLQGLTQFLRILTKSIDQTFQI